MSINREELEIQTHDTLKLRAILTKPRAPRAAVLLISGGGNVGASGDVSSPFIGSGYKGQTAHLNEQLAVALLESGIASLRYDKRGFADPGQIPTRTLPNLAADAKNALDRLRKEAPSLPTFLMGLSEGALVATQLAADGNVDGVFLLSPPTRPYPEALRYQFVEWPLRLIRQLDMENRGWITKEALFGADVPYLPLGDLDAPLAQFGLSLVPIQTAQLPFDSNGRLSFESITRIYEARFDQISVLLQAPFMKALYESYLALPPFTQMAQAVRVPAFIYVGAKDSQIAPEWMQEEARAFPKLAGVATFKEYGHCFSPMLGTIGQSKTSGPIAADVIRRIVRDVEALLTSEGKTGE